MNFIRKAAASILLLLISMSMSAKPSVPDSVLIINLFEQSSAEKLQNEYEKATTYSEKILILIKLSIKNYYPNAKCRELINHALQLSKKNNYKLGEGLAYLSLIRITETVSETDSVIKLATQIFEKEGYTQLTLLTKLHAAYTLTGNGESYVQIFSLINQFLSNYAVQSDAYSFSVAWNILGEVYRTIHNDVKAKECYLKSLSYAYSNERLINPSPMINMGTLYINIQKYDSALYYYNTVLRLDTTKNTSMLPYICNRKSQVYFLQHKYEEALQLANTSQSLYEKVKSKTGIIIVMGTLSKIYLALGQKEKFFEYAEKCVQEGLQIKYYSDEVQEACLLLADEYVKRNQYNKALAYQKIYTEIREDFFGPSINNKMYNEQLKLETLNQELEKALLLEKQSQAENEIKTQRQVISVIFIALAISITLSLLLLKKNKTIAHLNLELMSKNDEITAQSEELAASNEEIEAINANLESLVKERSEKVIIQNKKLTEYAFFNAHKVRGPLARILGLINVMDLELQKESLLHFASMLRQAGDDLDTSIKEVNTILESEHDISSNSENK